MSGIALEQPDWNDVLHRVRRHGRRRHAAEILVVFVLLIAGVASAYALGHPIVDFDKAPHAGLREVDDFGALNVVMPPMDPGVLPKDARRVTTFPFGSKTVTLYVAPTVGGGHCYEWKGVLGGGCSGKRPSPNDFGMELQRVLVGGRSIVTGLEGTFADASVARFVVGFADGTTDDVPFAWVTAPIDTGFYAYRVPATHRTIATRISWFELRDAHGTVLKHDALGAPRSRKVQVVRVAGLGRVTVPPGADWATHRLLFDNRGPHGKRYYLYALSTPGGKRCFTMSTTFGCVEPGLFLHGPVVCCSVRSATVRVEARFEDGARVALTPRDGYLLWPIPAAHWRLGHRIVSLVEYDRAGGAVTRDRVESPRDQRGKYSCTKQKSYGYGVKMCP